MSKKNRKTSKAAIAGLILAAATPCLFLISVLVLASNYEQLGDALIIFMLLLLVLPFLALPLSIAGVVISKSKERKGIAAGTIGLILSVLEIIFVVVTFSAFLLYEKRPGQSLDIVPPHFGYSSVTETSESEQDTQLVFTTGTKQLTLDDVIGLSSKGEELVWEDLSDFKGVETGSGLYIVTYKIDENYELMVGGTGAVGKPMYAHLIYVDDEYVDIMTDDAEAFISEHS
ncbi:MAG: hypothetical protein IIV94_02540 [Clostridiales bacterium]|nr:hypothetical protein [Clostridiales bacterium]